MLGQCPVTWWRALQPWEAPSGFCGNKMIKANQVKAGGDVQGCQPGWGEPVSHCHTWVGGSLGGGLTLPSSCLQVPAGP